MGLSARTVAEVSSAWSEHAVYIAADPAGKELVTLHTFILNFKAFIIGTYHGAERVHLQLYLDEFCFRFNRRNYRESMFERLLNAAVGCPAGK